ncbi:SDR family NAD(P)-dependent oxidoreductase [Streptomyces sp. WI04-05B]|uniref:SDR family NAD(P)-dependent oxidoreductase n=1 Tax=Streptomyces TaxID=1883 RepID=UPI0029A57C12|nr:MULTISPECIES: SDR family oxidoreductase [unclassified Streptomyces]MDX2545021.1 SDR family NAD(P)-dependent oxidoreductase [Streptomyces sp. WI04-05B]MDX2587512.1 SDR family NAD(P)-dependent oxidoreductase [Streptomyces sp. WI04-05A]MDX3748308.1 SDR family NAD(P)-dependent oxidoreductase [Streptomyces sp. AK08-02]
MPDKDPRDNARHSSEYEGRVALVTGGGRGFGKAFGEALSALGAYVVLADIDGDAAAEAAAELTARGRRATGISCDVADEAAVGAVVDEITERHGGLDLLVNNAGLHAAYNRPFTELGLANVRRVLDVNVMGVIICSLAAREAMKDRAGASIVNISSSAAYANRSIYGVSKLAVRGLTASFAREFAADGIRVNAIAPGLILTETVRAQLSAAEAERVLGEQILGREGEERDIVEALLYLASSKASFVTGETLRVTGGFALSI